MSINSSTCPLVFWWQPSAWLRVSGADAATFLQGQFTNDLRALTREAQVYGLWLTVKGKVLADSFVLRDGEAAFWIGSYFSKAEVIRERLESHIIADDVVIEDQTADWSGVSGLEIDPAAWAGVGEIGGMVFRGRRGTGPSAEWVFPRARTEEVRGRLAGARELAAAEMEQRRITAAIPAIPADLGPADLPNEGGLEVDAISYTKGCYLGQEVMARLKSLGQVRRRLWRVRGDGAAPGVPAAVFAGARQVGEIRSVAAAEGGGWIGLALVALLPVADGGELSLAASAPPTVRWVDRP